MQKQREKRGVKQVGIISMVMTELVLWVQVMGIMLMDVGLHCYINIPLVYCVQWGRQKQTSDQFYLQMIS